MKEKQITLEFHFLADGYGKNKAGDRCFPICSDCKNGKCISPESCKCDPGYDGPACDISKTN